MMRRMRRDLASELFDFLTEHPEGVTHPMIAEKLRTCDSTTKLAIQSLRDVLGNDDMINVTCDPNPDNPHGRWIYRLVGTIQEMSPWVGNRVGDAERRLITMLAMVKAAAAGTDGRTIEGRKARLIVRYIQRLLEDLQDIDVA